MNKRSSKEESPGWVGGLAEWTDGNTAYLSVAFTWKLPEARDRARWYQSLGMRVLAGGPATFMRRHYLEGVAELSAPIPDAVRFHNPEATYATKGCNMRCAFCNAWMIDGDFTYFPDFPVRPILCDNNLAGLDPAYQDYIIRRYQETGVPLRDANSGFEPSQFTESIFRRWQKVLRGPWRFGFDESKERPQVREMMHLLRHYRIPAKRIRPYVMIGDEPYADCMQRIYDVIAWGGEPHVQYKIKLNALEKEPQVRYDWTAEKLKAVARWANRRVWRYAKRFEDYLGPIKSRPERYDAQQGLFV